MMALSETKWQLQERNCMIMTISRFKIIRITENKNTVHVYLAYLTRAPRSSTPYSSCFKKIFIVSVFQLSHFYLDAM